MLRDSPWEVCVRKQPICHQLRTVNQHLSTQLLTAAPSMAKHANGIEWCGDTRTGGRWVVEVEVGGG